METRGNGGAHLNALGPKYCKFVGKTICHEE